MISPFSFFLGQKLLFDNLKFLVKTVFSQFVLCLTSNNSSSQNIEGRMHGPSPPKMCGGLSPSHP